MMGPGFGDAVGELMARRLAAVAIIFLAFGAGVVGIIQQLTGENPAQVRMNFEREAIEHGAAVYQADGKFRWVDVVAECNLSEKIGYERGLKAGSAKVFQWAKEKGIELPAE